MAVRPNETKMKESGKLNIKIDLKIFIFVIIFWITKQINIYVTLLLFTFIHECSHLIAGIIVKLKPESIKVSPYGFSISFQTKCEDYNKRIKKANRLAIKKILIALAGPLTNLLIAIIVYTYSAISGNCKVLGMNIDTVIYSNMLLFLFNMIPIYPLDGGRILKEIIYIYEGLEKSYYMVNTISNICIIVLTIFASFIILIFKNIAIVLCIVYLWIIVIKNNQNVKIVKNIYKNLGRTRKENVNENK